MQNVDFSVIVNMFGMEGMVALGKMKHPAMDSLNKNLDHAKFIIDILSVLEDKTKGNLSDTEHRTLDYTLSNLRLNYVQEMSSTSEVSTASDDDNSNGVA
ncbi:MAG: DUF1844 domain-containing protein [Candidatus Kapaibacterium sp.]|nr:DUF1844 domain-containing protein [Bacteroidota bacterium]